jgi:hypothetical protein
MATLSANVKDYQGRTVDLLAFDGARASGDTLLSQELAAPGRPGALITGIEKLVQRVLLELLTEQGSLTYSPDRGTFFMTSLRLGQVRTSQALFSAFSSAELDVKINITGDETAEDPADERYGSVTLLSVSLLGDTATLSIRVTSLAGEGRTVIYPLRVIN